MNSNIKNTSSATWAGALATEADELVRCTRCASTPITCGLQKTPRSVS